MGLLLANVRCVPAPAGSTVPLEGTVQALVLSDSSILLTAVQVGHQQLGNPSRHSVGDDELCWFLGGGDKHI